VIGSLLRSRRLKQSGRAAREGRLPSADYRATLEQEIARVLARQEDIGLPVVTDGELARTSWFGFFFEGLEGFRLELPISSSRTPMAQAWISRLVAAGQSWTRSSVPMALSAARW